MTSRQSYLHLHIYKINHCVLHYYQLISKLNSDIINIPFEYPFENIQ